MLDFNYFTYEVGRKGDKPNKHKLEWYVIDSDVRPVNIFELNRTFLICGLAFAKRHYYFNKRNFANHVRSWLQCEYWSRCQYEVIVSDVMGIDREYKLDVYTQIMLNWDRFIEYVWDNKHLIKKGEKW